MNADSTLLEIALPYQRKFIQAKQKRRIWISGRQLGKSFSIAFILVYRALTSKTKLSLCISTGARAAAEIIRKAVQFAEAVKLMSDGQITYTSTFDCIKFSNGGRVMSLPGSTDGANLRGFTASCVCIDEANFVEHLDLLLQAISPTLSRDPDAELILTTTPGGKHGPFWELYQKALSDEDVWYVQHTTVHDAIADGLKVDLASLRTLCPDPDVFAQEYECKFMDQFSSFIDISLLQFASTPQASVKAKYMGYDVGGSGDRTAIATVLELLDGTYFVEDVVMMHKADYQHQLDVLKQLYGQKHWNAGYVDSVGIGNPIAEFANRQVSANIHGFAWSASNKTNVHENTRALIFDRKLVFAEHLENIITSDFQNISRIVNEAGQVKYVAGRDANGHSDCASSVFLALWAAHEKPANMTNPISYVRFSPFGAWHSRLS